MYGAKGKLLVRLQENAVTSCCVLPRLPFMQSVIMLLFQIIYYKNSVSWLYLLQSILFIEHMVIGSPYHYPCYTSMQIQVLLIITLKCVNYRDRRKLCCQKSLSFLLWPFLLILFALWIFHWLPCTINKTCWVLPIISYRHENLGEDQSLALRYGAP